MITIQFAKDNCSAEYKGNTNDLNQIIQGFATDSRFVKKGDLFIALKGERVDGHQFIKQAIEKGAIAVLVQEFSDISIPQLKVNDSVKALGKIAKAHRSKFNLPIAALTGSCGKTTVKEMIASILARRGSVLATEGNLNTEIGLPLTLLRLNSEHQHAIIEMGARKKGDIEYLMQLTAPSVSLITNAGVAHMEVFGDEQGIAKAKGEIFEGLASNGTAVINADDKNAAYWQSLLSHQKLIYFGFKNKNIAYTITCEDISLKPFETQFTLITDAGKCNIHLFAPGEHNIHNALAAAAVARAMDINLDDIAEGLKQFKPVTGRLQFKTTTVGCSIIDDTYNANPVSMEAALSVLAQCPGQKIFVMGDMFELGKDQESMHQLIGKKAKEFNVDKLLGIGELTKHAVECFGKGATHFQNKKELINALLPDVNKTTTILIKGSRGMKMEEVVMALTDVRETNPC